MSPLSRKALLNEGAELYRGLALFQNRLCSLSAEPLDFETLNDLALMQESCRRAQRSITRVVSVLVREDRQQTEPH